MCLVVPETLFDHVVARFPSVRHKSLSRGARIDLSLLENNGIYLPIRQLGRLKGRRATETSAYRESGLLGSVQSVWRVYTYRG